jgi:hypothetical protein
LVDIGPSGRAYGRGVAVRLAILAPLILLNFYNAGRSGISRGVWWAIIGIGAVIAVIAVLRMVKRVQLTPWAVVIKRVGGAPTVVRHRQFGYGILAQYYQQFGNAAAPLLILVDGNGKKFLQLSGKLFAGSEMYALAQAIGLQRFDVINGPTSAQQIDQRHPKVLSVLERRPWAVAFAVVAVIVVLVIDVVVAAEG